MKRIFWITVVLMFALALASGAFAQEVKVGTLLSYTGPLKEFGPNLKNGCVLAEKQLKRVVAIVGALASGVTVPVAESVTCPSKVVQISPASTSPLITVLPSDTDADVLFRTCPSDALQGVIAGKLAVSFSKLASVLYVNNPYGQGLALQFKKSYERRGGKVLAMVPHDEKAAESYTAELKRALAGKPDVIGAFSYPEHAKVYIKEAFEFFKFRNFLYCDGTKSYDIVKAVGNKVVEGRWGTAPGAAKTGSYDLFVSDYRAEYGVLPPLPFITNAYDATAVIGLAAYACKVKGVPITSRNIRDQLRRLANPPGEVIKPGEFKKAFGLLDQGKDINYEGAAGSVDFDANGDVITPIEVWRYRKGDMVTVRIEIDIPRI